MAESVLRATAELAPNPCVVIWYPMYGGVVSQFDATAVAAIELLGGFGGYGFDCAPADPGRATRVSAAAARPTNAIRALRG